MRFFISPTLCTLYLRKNGSHLLLSVEHRAAPCRNNIPIELCADGSALALAVKTSEAESTTFSAMTTAAQKDPRNRVIQAMAELKAPVSIKQLRMLCRIRTATLCETLTTLKAQGSVIHGPRGYSLTKALCKTTVSLPETPIGSAGNGNGKRSPQLPLKIFSQSKLPSAQSPLKTLKGIIWMKPRNIEGKPQA